MSESLHDVSRLLGRLEQAVEDGARSRDLLRTDLKDHRQKSEEHHRCLEAKLDALAALLKPLTDDVAWMKPPVRDYQRLRNKLAGVLLGLTLFAGLVGVGGKSVGATIAKLLE